MKDTAIVIVCYNNADTIVRMHECIKQFCKDEYDIIIVDNSTKQEVTDAIVYRIRDLGCIYEKTNANSGDGSASHAFAANMAYWKYKDSYEYFMFLDFDNFPIAPFSVKELLGEKVIAGMGQTKPSGKTYMWAGCVCFNNNKVDKNLIDFSTNGEFGLDTGGNLYKVIESVGLEQCKFFNEHYSENIHFKKPRYNFYSIIHDGIFMHWVGSSNWIGLTEEEHQERMSTLMVCLGEEITKRNSA